MAVASAAVMDSIVILDDDEEEERPQPSSSTRSSKPSANHRTPPKIQQPAPTHITQSPFATVKKESHVLKAENQKLFTEVRGYMDGWMDGGDVWWRCLVQSHYKYVSGAATLESTTTAVALSLCRSRKS
jgi:hypothetical protein